MAAATVPARTHAISPPWRRARAALTATISQGTRMASAARARIQRPALAIGGLACFDTAAWHTFGTGAGLLVLGACLWALEFISGDE